MVQDWNSLATRFEQAAKDGGEAQAALEGVAGVARYINAGPLSRVLFGWASMADLCVQQTSAAPYSVAFLRLSPKPDGTVEFRYEDTRKSDRQWHRVVPADASVPRLEAFLDQLRWIAR
jgi:hypothetical protein